MPIYGVYDVYIQIYVVTPTRTTYWCGYRCKRKFERYADITYKCPLDDIIFYTALSFFNLSRMTVGPIMRKTVLGLLLCAALIVFPYNYYLQTSDVYGTTSIKDLKWQDVNFIHTTDTHGWYSGHKNQKQYSADWGDFISFIHQLRKIADSNKQDFLVVDTGDRHDGNGLSDITVPNGAKSLPIFVKADYDLITIGNHELYLWENSKQEFDIVAKHFGSNYICSNVEFKLDNGDQVPFGQKFKYFETPNQKVRVLSFAFLFDFTRNNDGTVVTPLVKVIEQAWFLDTLAKYPKEKVDLLVIFGHVPIAHSWKELYVLHELLRKYYPTTKIQYFGGHSHIRDFTVFDANLTALQSGRFCETVGWVSVALESNEGSTAKDSFSRSYIDFNIDSFLYHTNRSNIKEFKTEFGEEVSEEIVETRKLLGLDKIIGHVKSSNYYMDYVPLDHPKNLFKLITDKILYTLVPAGKGGHSDERLIIINTGSVRYDLYKGPYTIDTQFIISPFENDWAKISLPKSIAVQIAPTLNRGGFIMTESDDIEGAIDNRRLLPIHQYSQRLKEQKLGQSSFIGSSQTPFKYPFFSEFLEENANFDSLRLSKGYVTHDDFGVDGDDTPHRPVVNFPVTNVVQSTQLNATTGGDAIVDVVFYNFITQNIVWALNEIGYEGEAKPEFYSNVYLGQLINSYIKKYDV